MQSGDLVTRQAVLVFTDIADSVADKGRLGPTRYTERKTRHDALLRAAFATADVLNDAGDGYLLAVTEPSVAVRSALDFVARLRDAGSDVPRVRIGMHAGEFADHAGLRGCQPVGLAVDLAARVAALAGPGQILLTRSVFDSARQFVGDGGGDARTGPGLSWIAHGPYLFKGNDDALEIFEVGVPGLAPLTAPPDGEKGRRAIAPDEAELLGWRPAAGLEIPGRQGWVLRRKLGDGGFGEVWLGVHRRLGEQRVFKFCFEADRVRSIRRELTLFRLLREALGDRDDIARIYDVRLDRPPYFLESAFTPEGNLVDWAERQGGLAAVPLATRIALLADVADAVAAAHSVGVLHQDLKPANVLIYLDGDTPRPRLADFGISVLTDRGRLASASVTVTGLTDTVAAPAGSGLAGTRLYAPPEALAGRPFTTQGDVYALGVMLFQLVVADAQRPLAHGWESAICRAVPDAALATLLIEDIAACVAGDLGVRLPTATTLADRLRAVQRRGVEAARRAAEVVATERRERAAKRLWTGLGVAVALLVVAGGFGAFSLAQWRRAEGQAAIARQHGLLAEQERDRANLSARRAETEATRTSRLAEFMQAKYMLESKGRPREAFHHLRNALQSGWSWDCGHLLADVIGAARDRWVLVARVPAPGGAAAAVAGPPAQPWLAVAVGPALTLYALPAGRPVSVARLPGDVALLRAVGDDRLACVTAHALHLYSLPALAPLAQLELPGRTASLESDLAGQRIALLAETCEARVLDGRTLAPIAQRAFLPPRPAAGDFPIPRLDLSPSGRAALYSTNIADEGPAWWMVDSAETPPQLRWMNHARFAADNAVIGVDYLNTAGAPRVTLRPFPDQHGDTDLVSWELEPASAGELATARVPHLDPQGGVDFALLSAEQITLVDGDADAAYAQRLDSLVPTAPDQVAPLALDLVRRRLLVLRADDHVWVLQATRPGDADEDWDLPPVRPWARITLATDGYSFASTPDAFWTAGWGDTDPTLEVARMGRSDGLAVTGEIATTQPADAGVAGASSGGAIWGLAVTPDGRLAAVIEHEGDGNTTRSVYDRKAAVLYRLPPPDAPRDTPAHEIRRFELPQFRGLSPRIGLWAGLSADGATLVYISGSRAIGYATADGRTLYDVEAGGTVALGPRGRRFATAPAEARGEIVVRDLPSGAVVTTWPSDRRVVRLAFSPDEERLYVGDVGGVLRTYRVSDGAELGQVMTRAAPVAISPRSDIYLGFVPERDDARMLGRLVVASLESGATVSVLEDRVHVLVRGAFSADGQAIGYNGRRTLVSVVLSYTLDQAVAILERTTAAFDPETPAAPPHAASAPVPAGSARP